MNAEGKSYLNKTAQPIDTRRPSESISHRPAQLPQGSQPSLLIRQRVIKRLAVDNASLQGRQHLPMRLTRKDTTPKKKRCQYQRLL
jgi:hypothetical protein